MPALLENKRDGQEFSQKELTWIVANLETMPREQIGAFLMACQLQGLNHRETSALTQAMLHSGHRFESEPKRVDKHSTGGVGDKMSIILAPALHACGAIVPMLAGRGLAHTGGTIDKLESIPGFNTGLTLEEMRQNPCFISRQTSEIAPADSILYSIRDITGTVPCIGLITASIISKKAAEGLNKLVLDVKCGKAAFMKTRQQAQELADSMKQAGESLGIQVTTQINSMDQPIGTHIGNSHEIFEAIQCLKGKGPKDTMDLVYSQADALGYDIREVIDNGSALNEFKLMCIRQGVESEIVERLIEEPWGVLPKASTRIAIKAKTTGLIKDINALTIGQVLCELGAGRAFPEQEINHGIGIIIHAKVGTEVKFGDTILSIDCDEINSGMIDELSQAIAVE